MSNIRLFFSAALSTDMTDKLDKSQSHYLMSILLQKNVKIKSEISGKVLQIIGEQLNWNTLGCEV